MILQRLFRPKPQAERKLYEAIVAAARHPVFYARWGVADTIDGRFDMIILHAFAVLERMKGEAPEFRQRLVDEMFSDMDRSLREMGVGDLSVGKRIRVMAEVFYGRISAYESAFKKTTRRKPWLQLVSQYHRHVHRTGGGFRTRRTE